MRRLVALLPPARLHLTSFHGVLAPNASLRPLATRQPEAQAPAGPRAKVPPKKKTKKRRLDWATLHQRTFGTDVLRCLPSRTLPQATAPPQLTFAV